MNVRVDHAAVLDIETAREWYADQGEGLASRFEHAVDEAVRDVAEDPERYPIVYRSARRKRLATFPYNLYYVVSTEPEEHVLVIACVHGRRAEAHWRDRAPRD